MATRIVIFEDNEKVRSSLVTLLGNESAYVVTGAHPDASDVGRRIRQETPHVVILDIDMPGMNGISAIPLIKEVDPEISIVMYTQFEDDEKLFKSLCAGADGYVLKKTSPGNLLAAIEEVRAGGAPLSPAVARKVLFSFRDQRQSSHAKYELTDREIEVLQLLIKGYSVKLIAAELHIAYDTCRSHLRNIYRKLHVNCGKEAIAKVLAEKIVL
ncbi:response regulator [Salinimicrobium xinjiangense]|uniref:response regulator n=1 Tax=Salinimicrobium xinjiangense TaxID=438596 RepID=UPI0004239C0B|nr:response regulator transcription factor [Salinimicrobium xinjiangense]